MVTWRAAFTDGAKTQVLFSILLAPQTVDLALMIIGQDHIVPGSAGTVVVLFLSGAHWSIALPMRCENVPSQVGSHDP
jgi:hypothetical protein